MTRRGVTRSFRLKLVIFLVALGCFHQSVVFAQECLAPVGIWPYGPTFSALAASDNYVYFDSGTSLLIADISDPTSLEVVGEIALPDRLERIVLSGSFVYVANRSAGLRIIDVSTPTAPIEVGFYDTPLGAIGVAVSGDLAYVVGGEFLIVDVSTPSAPVEVSRTGWGAGDIAVSGSYAYQVIGEYITVIDVSDPTAPVYVGQHKSADYINDSGLSTSL